ncbi:ATP-binding cassette domain-containing protein [Pectinatus frisingensis]|uniref:ATP-binding cassette domain-containing protein n=1 Tax=Pectinatus frisingensis TaxID=865 RepID=UPI0018C72615|nr:ATP-binding cassette domain-containing protein [Pectinatus frisingensis]
MDNVINSIIKFDLHIHSQASSYKEKNGIVDNSTVENIDILLGKLQENEVALFSITDHNRFDANLYSEIIKKLNSNEYPTVKNILAGVEFDVKLEEDMGKCHIIAIFDTNNEDEKLQLIQKNIQSNLLKTPEESYGKKQFESLLSSINLDVILIAAQRKNINNHNGKHNSLSDTTIDVEKIMRVGYINALEFQKPKVEGILINNLKKIELPMTLVSGSDCHDWMCYPYHDTINQNVGFRHSRAKILPTFKGLLMAITSPEIRFNFSENENRKFIEKFTIKNKDIPLVNGINVIIGENGSGKSTLLKLLAETNHQSYVRKIISDNNLTKDDNLRESEIKYIYQGEVIQKFNDNELFNNDEKYFNKIDNTKFESMYRKYAKLIKEKIVRTIETKDKMDKLSNTIVKFEEGMNDKFFYVHTTNNDDISSEEDTQYREAKEKITKLKADTEMLLGNKVFEPYTKKLNNMIQVIDSIKNEIIDKYKEISYGNKVKNIISSCIKTYEMAVQEKNTANERLIFVYKNKCNSLVKDVVDAIKVQTRVNEWPEHPPKIKGNSSKLQNGFSFNKENKYDGVSVINEFYSAMFTKEYNQEEKLNTINNNVQFQEAVKGCSKVSDIEKIWTKNLEKFLAECEKESSYILEGAKDRLGNTMGELSLTYYKFFTQDTEKWNTLIIDQPEDNISNNNITKKLITYFNNIRNHKQLIFVTHNPLLVVNLDADNIIFVENNAGQISVSNGCLEYENDKINILDIVAKNMDGGKETIEKRLKVYGKEH